MVSRKKKVDLLQGEGDEAEAPLAAIQVADKLLDSFSLGRVTYKRRLLFFPSVPPNDCERYSQWLAQ